MRRANLLRRAILLLCLACAVAPVLVQAQAWPSRPIRIIVAYPTGGVSDVVARALGEKLAIQLQQPVVIENRAGAGGSIGMDAVAKAPPDGYTFGFAAISPLVLNPHIGKVAYDPMKDIVPVASVMFSPVVLLATPAFEGKDFGALLAAARAKPGAVRWATSGLATIGHITLEQIKARARVDITHIPYKGGGQVMTDALGGQFEVFTTNPAPALSAHIASGKLRPLAVGAPRRFETLPDVPTFAELGFEAANLTSTFGVFAPARVPDDVLARVNAEINKALAAPDLRERLRATDNVPTGGDAKQFAELIRNEYRMNERIIRESGIRAE
jgi:tripartite-type tricarboxylate transporter receptor subunit TctC